MSIYRRGKIWWVRFTAPSGQRICRTAKTENRVEAQEFHDRLKHEYWRVQQLKSRPNYTWQQAVVRWLTEKSHKKSINDDRLLLIKLDVHLRGYFLNQIDADKIGQITTARLDEGVSNSTVNRMLSVLRSILRRAVNQWDWLDNAPHVTMLEESKLRIRWLTSEEAYRLLSELPCHLRAMASFTLATGLRAGNIVNLKWSQIDLDRRIGWFYADEMKNENAFAVPLNDDAINILTAQLNQHDEYVFVYNNKPIVRPNNHAWIKALKRAGIENFRWHDLRHTWASWHVQAGTPIHVLQELGGWQSVEMVRRYAHLSTAHLDQHAANVIQPYSGADDTILVQDGESN